MDPGQIIRSASPELTIGSGLAIYNVLSRRYEIACAALRGEAVSRRKDFDSAVVKTIGDFARAVAHDVVDPLMDEVQGIFLKWRIEGGSLDEVEMRVDEVCKAIDVRQVVERHTQTLLDNLLKTLRDHLRRWLLEHNIEREVDQFVPARFVLSMGEGEPVRNTADSIAQDIAKGVGGALAVVVAGIILLIQAHLHAAWFLADFLTATIALLAGILVKYSKFKLPEKIHRQGQRFRLEESQGPLVGQPAPEGGSESPARADLRGPDQAEALREPDESHDRPRGRDPEQDDRAPRHRLREIRVGDRASHRGSRLPRPRPDQGHLRRHPRSSGRIKDRLAASPCLL